MEINPNLSENARYDAQLILNARLGVENAFVQLMSRYKDAIYYMILKMVNNKTDAEDLTIEAFEKAFINIHQYEPNFAFTTWLFCIASNNTIDFLRRKRVVSVPFGSPNATTKNFGTDFLYNIRAPADNPEEALIKEQNSRFLHKAISSLKPRYRILLEMRYFKEYSYSEICKELNLPLGTVKVQLFRSREMLYQLLKDAEISYHSNDINQYTN